MSIARHGRAAAWLAVAVALGAGPGASSAAVDHRPSVVAGRLRADRIGQGGHPATSGLRSIAGSDRDAEGGGLPEPASWVLMVIGVGMIGGALRGFVVANRNLARLQPEEPE
jgi:hypothetical protein